MVKTHINANNLATILGTQKSTVYYIMHPEKKMELAIKKAKKENRPTNVKSRSTNINYRKLNNSIIIDIDNLLNEHKISKSFNFIGESFLDRMLVKIDIASYPSYLSTSQVISLTGFDKYKVMKLRSKINIKTVTDLKYPITSKGRIQYLYEKDDLLKYLYSNGFDITSKQIYKFSKQFFSAKEVVVYLKEQYSIDRSLSSIYRRILVTKEIPAIRFGYMLKIPILELKQLDMMHIFTYVHDEDNEFDSEFYE